jgi:hypothetical protein
MDYFFTFLNDLNNLHLFHKTLEKNRNYRGTIGSSIINGTKFQHLINHRKDDKFRLKLKKRLNKK